MGYTNLRNRYSYSGSDAKVYAYYHKNKQQVALESMHTISWSIFEAKGRVRSLGFKSIRGFTRAVREISGTMIMTVIEGHPLAPLMAIDPAVRSPYYGGSQHSWSFDMHSTAKGSMGINLDQDRLGGSTPSFSRVPTTLSPFNIRMVYNTETPHTVTNQAQRAHLGVNVSETNNMFRSKTLDPVMNITYDQELTDGAAYVELIDVEIMGQGMVTSVNDMVTEVQYQFVARDLLEFSFIPKIWEERLTDLSYQRDLNKEEFAEFLSGLKEANKSIGNLISTDREGNITITSVWNDKADPMPDNVINALKKEMSTEEADPVAQNSPEVKEVIEEAQNEEEVEEALDENDEPEMSEQDTQNVEALANFLQTNPAGLEDAIANAITNGDGLDLSGLPGYPTLNTEEGVNVLTMLEGAGKIEADGNKHLYTGSFVTYYNGSRIGEPKEFSFTK